MYWKLKTVFIVQNQQHAVTLKALNTSPFYYEQWIPAETQNFLPTFFVVSHLRFIFESMQLQIGFTVTRFVSALMTNGNVHGLSIISQFAFLRKPDCDSRKKKKTKINKTTHDLYVTLGMQQCYKIKRLLNLLGAIHQVHTQMQKNPLNLQNKGVYLPHKCV